MLSGDDVDVEASDKALELWRNSKDGRLTNAIKGKRKNGSTEARAEPGIDEKGMSEVVEATGATMTKEEASRVKERPC